jgi:hypothetical protein
VKEHPFNTIQDSANWNERLLTALPGTSTKNEPREQDPRGTPADDPRQKLNGPIPSRLMSHGKASRKRKINESSIDVEK